MKKTDAYGSKFDKSKPIAAKSKQKLERSKVNNSSSYLPELDCDNSSSQFAKRNTSERDTKPSGNHRLPDIAVSPALPLKFINLMYYRKIHFQRTITLTQAMSD